MAVGPKQKLMPPRRVICFFKHLIMRGFPLFLVLQTVQAHAVHAYKFYWLVEAGNSRHCMIVPNDVTK